MLYHNWIGFHCNDYRPPQVDNSTCSPCAGEQVPSPVTTPLGIKQKKKYKRTKEHGRVVFPPSSQGTQ